MNEATSPELQEDNKLPLGNLKSQPLSERIGKDAGNGRFNIPIFSSNSINLPTSQQTNNDLKNQSNSLNQFVLSQLGKNVNGSETIQAGVFKIPQLQNSKREGSVNTVVKTNKLLTVVVEQQLKQMTIADKSMNPICDNEPIDLTTALSTTKFAANEKPKENIAEAEFFDIPFIDCDRQHKSLPETDKYCIWDASQKILSVEMAKPSNLGRILCKDKKRKIPPDYGELTLSELRKESANGNHGIEVFKFDCPSPDDIVQAAQSKFKRLI